MIVLDASVLIALMDSTDAHHAQAREFFLAAGTAALGMSTVNLAEVYVGPLRAGKSERVQEIVSQLDIAEIPVAAGALDLAGLREQTGLRLPDCCVLLAARSRDGAVASFDRRLTEAAELCDIPTFG